MSYAPRAPACWIPAEPGLFQWGDWFIMRDPGGFGGLGSFRLLVSSGQEYGPFTSLIAAKQHAEHVRAD